MQNAVTERLNRYADRVGYGQARMAKIRWRHDPTAPRGSARRYVAHIAGNEARDSLLGRDYMSGASERACRAEMDRVAGLYR